MVQKKFLGYIPSLMVRGLENIYADEAAQAVPEIFKEDIAAFGNKQIFDMVRVALDMLEDVAENRIRRVPCTWRSKGRLLSGSGNKKCSVRYSRGR